ncbi:hypothetical protein FOCG_12042 [Fusarium oxysporum f. sp. radicis-lycopersici 26381]|uniref:Uncharacterized protein n=1 Tax=Fusarium oxysporum Fo47 TaxID=660027 RepID=W9KXQ4_FUSOX|nr:hypothetical protein FOZG_00204 [Fusarium oxysporum Fo47]EXL46056.1 hypothetical protein FOCG_12042 [Fusarium oxysporum f. sp. radicis-lycopersici 26381]
MEELGYELDRLFSAVAQDWKFISTPVQGDSKISITFVA